MRTVQDLINESKNPRYKGRNANKPPETGPLRQHKPAVYNAKTVPNPVISKETAQKLLGDEASKPWVPQYGKKK